MEEKCVWDARLETLFYHWFHWLMHLNTVATELDLHAIHAIHTPLHSSSPRLSCYVFCTILYLFWALFYPPTPKKAHIICMQNYKGFFYIFCQLYRSCDYHCILYFFKISKICPAFKTCSTNTTTLLFYCNLILDVSNLIFRNFKKNLRYKTLYILRQINSNDDAQSITYRTLSSPPFVHSSNCSVGVVVQSCSQSISQSVSQSVRQSVSQSIITWWSVDDQSMISRSLHQSTIPLFARSLTFYLTLLIV